MEFFRPVIWVYGLEHLHSGLTFAEASVHISGANRDRLTSKAKQQLGKDFNPPFLMTKGGLDHPMTIAIDGGLRSFTPSVGIYPVSKDSEEDLISWSMQERSRRRSGNQLQELEGRDWEIWAMMMHPNPQHRYYRRVRDPELPLINASASSEDLEGPVRAIYQDFVKNHRELADHKLITLGWYTRGYERFRLATRPYRAGNLENHRLVIATTLPVESPSPSTV